MLLLPPALIAPLDRLRGRLLERLPVDRWGRIRMWSGAAWVAMSLMALGIALHDPATNPLGARVSVVTTGLGTAVVVRNQGDATWEELTVALNPGDWRIRRSTLRPGERLTLEVGSFSRVGSEGEEQAPMHWRPTAVTISTRDDAVTLETP